MVKEAGSHVKAQKLAVMKSEGANYDANLQERTTLPRSLALRFRCHPGA